MLDELEAPDEPEPPVPDGLDLALSARQNRGFGPVPPARSGARRRGR